MSLEKESEDENEIKVFKIRTSTFCSSKLSKIFQRQTRTLRQGIKRQLSQHAFIQKMIDDHSK